MPVDYTIASRVPQMSGGGMDPINMLAQMQAMDYRQRQNALAEMQMAEYQRRLQAEQALRGMTPNFEDPRFAQQAFQYDPEFARQLYGSRLAGERERRMAEQAAASAEATRGEQFLRQREFEEIKLPRAALEKKELETKISKEERIARESLAKADTAVLDLGIRKTAAAQDALSQYDPDAPDTWGQTYNTIKETYPEFAGKFKADKPPTVKEIDSAMKNADMVRRIAENTIRQRTEAEFAPPQTPSFAPGYVMRYDKATNQYYLDAPRQPGAMPSAANAMLTPSTQPQNAFSGRPLTPMDEEAAAPPTPGKIKAIDAPSPPIGTPDYEIRRAARSVLDIAGVDLEKGTNRVADLIKNTPSSAFRAYAQQKSGAFTGKATPEMENVGRLNTIIDNMVLAAANNKLGGQVSDADVRLLKEAQAQINDPSIQPNQRLAAWDEVLRIKAKQAGYSYSPMSMSQIREQPIIGERKAASEIDENAILTDLFGAKK